MNTNNGLAAMAGIYFPVSYTINGEQPVTCSIIGDQPLKNL